MVLLQWSSSSSRRKSHCSWGRFRRPSGSQRWRQDYAPQTDARPLEARARHYTCLWRTSAGEFTPHRLHASAPPFQPEFSNISAGCGAHGKAAAGPRLVSIHPKRQDGSATGPGKSGNGGICRSPRRGALWRAAAEGLHCQSAGG